MFVLRSSVLLIIICSYIRHEAASFLFASWASAWRFYTATLSVLSVAKSIHIRSHVRSVSHFEHESLRASYASAGQVNVIYGKAIMVSSRCSRKKQKMKVYRKCVRSQEQSNIHALSLPRISNGLGRLESPRRNALQRCSFPVFI